MTIKLRYFAPLLVAGAAAAAIAVAPGASAASVTTTVDSGSATTTQRPGHVAIQANPPDVSPPHVLGSVLFSTFHLGRLGETQSNREAAEIGTFILLRGFRLFCRMAVRGMCST